VPGSSANLGSGFDSLAVALDCMLRVDVIPRDDDIVRESGSPDLLGGNNLVLDAMHLASNRFGLQLAGCDVCVTSDIPVARGLGSSAAALVAGIVAAGIVGGRTLSSDEIIDLAGGIEGHADNVSASVLGGVTVSIKSPTGWIADVVAARLPWAPVVFIPDGHAFTREARAILPEAPPLADVVANLGRAALLVHALHYQRADLLRDAMADRLHQPYRATIFPHLDPCIMAALDAGAAGACLSGAGPAILAFALPEHAARVGEAMRLAAAAHGVDGCSQCMAIPSQGATVSPLG
jgi:homoserine kinase